MAHKGSRGPTRLSRARDGLVRSLRIFRSPYFLAPAVVLLLIGLGGLALLYDRYSRIIDAGLQGDIFVRTSGIYAAPLVLHRGGSTRMNDLLEHLTALGYVDQRPEASGARGAYRVNGSTVEIIPSDDAKIDETRAFHQLRVTFGRGGGGIVNLVDLDTRTEIEQADVEPELISTVTNKDREKRKIIDYRDLPAELVAAIVVIEDRQFFEHPGINWRGILRALIRDYQAGAIREGGSSITQQLVKNFFLKPDRTWKRKLSEAYMSLILEQRLSKEEIMALYCNQIYLGQRGGFSINGFGQAARTYFGKDILNLALHESALLAGIIRSPNYYSPYSNPDRARERRNLVLEKMAEEGRITRAQAESAQNQPLGITGKSQGVNASDAPYFIDYLIRQLEREYEGSEQSLRSLRIYSTIDLNLQRAAYQAVTENMARVEGLVRQRRRDTSGLQVAMVALNAKSGEILAMVGGRDYSQSQLNRAVDARRQPGSVFKPFVYAAALEAGESSGQFGDGSGITPATTFLDQPKSFEVDGKPYAPGNFGDQYEMKAVTVRDALVQSKNVITVEIATQIGISRVQAFAERAGLTRVPGYASSALGVGEATPLQVASAYTAFANQGTRVAPVAIRKLTSREGRTIDEMKRETSPVMSPALAFVMTSIMQDVLDRGTGTSVRQRGFTAPAAGKTGSSRDAWFAGYTPNLVCVVWVGFDNNTDIGLTGGSIAAPIWADFMTQALRVRPELGGDFVLPGEGLTSYQIDPATGMVVPEGTPSSRIEYFLTGTGPNTQPLPDSFTPDGDRTPEKAESGSSPERPDDVAGEVTTAKPRATPTPFRPSAASSPTAEVATGRPGRGGMASSEDFIPLPPQTRLTPAPRSSPAPPPQPAESGGLSILQRLAKSLGFGPKPSPTPAPKQSPQSVQKTGRKTTEKQAAATPRPTAAPPVRRPEPRPESPPETIQREAAAEGFRLNVCPKSGLLPIPGLCPTTSRWFRLGKEPTTQCNPGYHR